MSVKLYGECSKYILLTYDITEKIRFLHGWLKVFENVNISNKKNRVPLVANQSGPHKAAGGKSPPKNRTTAAQGRTALG